MVLAERLEVAQQSLYQRRRRRRNSTLLPGSSIEVLEQGLPGAFLREKPLDLRALAGAGEQHDGNRRGDRLRRDLGGLLQVRAERRQFPLHI